MYGLKYISYFRDLEEALFSVEILKEGYSGNVTELTGGVPPFTVSYKTDDFLYAPLRLSGATLKIVGGDYLRELFTEGVHAHKVNLKKGGEIVWTGFIAPEVYSQDYSRDLFEFEIECVSALSTMEYIKFEKEGDMVNLFTLLKDAVTKTNGDYKHIYIPKTFGSINVLKEWSILSDNFIDEDGDSMTYKEILEEICKLCSWTLTDFSGSAYFIDVDYIKAGYNEYFCYDSPSFSETSVNLPVTEQNVQQIGFAGTGGTMDILPGYNKVNVVCSDYEVDSDVLYPEIDNSLLDSERGEGKTQKSTRLWKNYFEESKDDFAKWDLKTYARDGESFVKTGLEFNPISPELGAQKSAGAVLCSRTNYDTEDKPNVLKDEYLIQIKLFYGRDMSLLLDKEESMYTVIKTAKKTPSFFLDRDCKMAIYFDVQYFDGDDGFVGTSAQNKQDKVSSLDAQILNALKDWCVPVSLRVGKWYYDGEGNWKEGAEHVFKIYTDLKANSQHFTFDWLSAQNDFDFTDRTPDLKGKKVLFKDGIFGDVEMTVYCPRSTTRRDYNHRFIFMKNLSIKVQKIQQRGASAGGSKQDTLYEHEINDVYINQADDVELKLTSKNNSELSYSKIIYNNEVLDTIYNRITNSDIKPEKLIIQRVVNQYRRAKIKMSQPLKSEVMPYRLVTDNQQKNRKFIAVGYDADYKMCKSSTTLIEVV